MIRRLLAPALAAAVLLAARPALAAEEGGSALTLVWNAINLALLVGVIVYFARKPVVQNLRARRREIADDLETSAGLLKQGEARLAEWRERVERLDAELAEIRDTSRRLAEEEREAILAQAHATAERIRRDAQAAVEQEVRRARRELADEATALAVELAEGLLRENVGSADQTRLFDEFLEQVRASEARRPGDGGGPDAGPDAAAGGARPGAGS